MPQIFLGASIGLVASMNLHSFSGNESKEVGVCFTDENSLKKLRDKMKKWGDQSSEVDPITAATKPETPERKKIQVAATEASRSSVSAPKAKGYCISCGERIPLNGERPLCETHFDSLRKRLQEYQGNYCHRCGNKEVTKHDRPLCHDCWEKMGKPKFAAPGKF